MPRLCGGRLKYPILVFLVFSSLQVSLHASLWFDTSTRAGYRHSLRFLSFNQIESCAYTMTIQLDELRTR